MTVAPMTLSSGPLAMDRSQFRAAERERRGEDDQPSGYVTGVEFEMTIRLRRTGVSRSAGSRCGG